MVFCSIFFLNSYLNFKNNLSKLEKKIVHKKIFFEEKENLINKPTNLVKCLNSLMSYKKDKNNYKTLSVEKRKEVLAAFSTKNEDKLALINSEVNLKHLNILKKEEKETITKEMKGSEGNQEINAYIEEEKQARSEKLDIDITFEEIRERTPSNENEENLKRLKKAITGEESKEDSEEKDSETSKERRKSSFENKQTNYVYLEELKDESSKKTNFNVFSK